LTLLKNKFIRKDGLEPLPTSSKAFTLPITPFFFYGIKFTVLKGASTPFQESINNNPRLFSLIELFSFGGLLSTIKYSILKKIHFYLFFFEMQANS